MYLYKFALGSVVFLINLYAEYFEKKELYLTLKELQFDANLPRIKIYDFIIVGGGGAGCIVANRLSTAGHSVLLLEAGGNPVPATQALVHYSEYATHPRINFLFNSVPSSKATLQYGGVNVSPHGKMLGGSTSHNGLIFNRPNPRDLDHWAEVINDSSWTYENVKKYFVKSEKYIGETDNGGQKLEHGYKGPLTIDTARTPLLSTWLKAGAELGFKTGLDPNAPQFEGFVAESVVQKKGRRVSSYTAYIAPIEKTTKTLKIERYSIAYEILTTKGRAYGIAYKRHGIPQIAHGSKEIIISCGSPGSPLLLMKSGIGPANILAEAGIPLVKDLPAGSEIHEHPGVSLPSYTMNENARQSFVDLKRDLTEDALVKFHNTGSGPLVLSLEGQAYVTSTRAKRANEAGYPDLVLQLGQPLPWKPGQDNSDASVPSTFWLGTTLERNTSKGTLTLNTTAYKLGLREDEELAVIDFKLLDDDSDVEVILEGIKLWLKILEKTKAFRKFGIKIQNPNLPGCASYSWRSDEYWRCYIHQTSHISYHLTSGCKMGFGIGDKSAVLDSKMNVLGVEGLKVVDGSVMPGDVNTNPMAVVVMIAEKASAEILAKWKVRDATENDVVQQATVIQCRREYPDG